MAVYRFKVSFEDYDDVVREIDIKSYQTFLDLHHAIHASTGYDPELQSSFFVSNDQWIKGDEIAYLPVERKSNRGVTLMADSKLSKFIDDPHQKFYYTYNFDRPFDFHIELMKIILDEDPNKQYPYVFRSSGEVPKIRGKDFIPISAPGAEDEFDFLNNMEFVPEDTEELEAMGEMGINADETEQEEEEAEKDEFMDEFSDEQFDADDYQKDE